jgi:murein DD-endopeptidase MepM/ murein hydrolase activator NlpD
LPAASPSPQLVFVTVTPLPSLPVLPTAGPTVTAAPEDLPPTPGTPCLDQACASAAEHFWLARPVPPDANVYVDRTYAYGSTQQGQREPHHGVEFVNRAGTPVLAVAPGTVVVAGDDSLIAYGPATRFYGQLVVVRLDQQFNGQDVYTLYAHLLVVTAQVGQTVKTGDVLGAVGQTGVAIGPHLHFEVRVGRNAYTHTRNPELWLKPLTGANNTPYGALAGRITDLDGNVLYDLPVVVRPLEVGEPTRAKYLTTYARETLNGDDVLQENFALGDLPAGTYRVAVNTTTFYEQTVRVEPGRLTWVIFRVRAPGR